MPVATNRTTAGKQAKPKKPNWRQLKHTEGSASDVPKLVESFLAFSQGRGVQPRDDLLGLFDGDGEWFSASGPTIQLLLDGFSETEDNFLLLPLVAELLGAGATRAWVRPLGKTCPDDLEEIVVAHQQTLWKALLSSHPQIRSGAILVLALSARLASESCPLLLKILNEDASEGVQASAILALGRLAEIAEAVERPIAELLKNASAPAIVRGAAALTRLRSTKTDGSEIDETLAA